MFIDRGALLPSPRPPLLWLTARPRDERLARDRPEGGVDVPLSPARRLAPLVLLASLLLPRGRLRAAQERATWRGETLTKTFRFGPFTLGPGREIQGSPSSGMPRPAGAFGLRGARFDVVDQNGTPVSVHDVHLHHIVMTTSARQDRLCPGRRERFIGSGMERTRSRWGVHTPTLLARTTSGDRSTT